ncbi:MAG: ABC transporter ATP-binding protein [Bacteroidetes bacterium]|nr:ABC transporter ATP-binding protein [Bacteroidota bacterium]
MLQIENVSIKFGNIEALKGINLKVQKGEFFGLLGPNGAGKSTLMKIIVGYLKPDNGHVIMGNELVVYDNVNFRRKIGFVPQEISLYLELSAYQNLKIFGGFYNIPGKVLEEKITEVLKLVQLEDRKKDAVKNFSGGMKRRLNIAASILHDPELILCDEPTVGVDPQSRNAIFDMLMKLNREGKTIIYTTHYMEEAERMCPRLAIIDYGQIIAEGTLTELKKMLERQVTLKVLKTSITIEKTNELSQIGKLLELDGHYEIIPNEYFELNSKLFYYLEELGIPADIINLSRASLEDVFLSLTGRSLRD